MHPNLDRGVPAEYQPAPAFDEARYRDALGLYEEAARHGMSIADPKPWDSILALDQDPRYEQVLRDSLSTEFVGDTIRLLDIVMDSMSSQAQVLGLRVITGDSYASLLAAIEQHDPDTSDRLIDVLGQAYIFDGCPKLITDRLVHLLPARIARECQRHDDRSETMTEQQTEKFSCAIDTLAYSMPDDQQRIQLAKQLISASSAQPSGGNMDKFAGQLLLGGSNFPYYISHHMFKAVGLDDALTFKLWQAGYGPDTLPDGTLDPTCRSLADYIQVSAQRILDIERQRPGGVKFLLRRLHLSNLGRMPEDWLIDLIDSRRRRYGRAILVDISPFCPNGAMEQICDEVNKARKQLPEDVIVIPVESNTPGQLEERLKLLERAHGVTPHQIKYIGAILAGHGHGGDELTMTVTYGGRGSCSVKLSKSHITDSLGGLLGRLLEPDAQTLALSCEIAKGPSSLAEELHKTSGLHVSGLRETGGLRRLRIGIKRDTGVAQFRPELVKRKPGPNNNWVYPRINARHFRPGTGTVPSTNSQN